LQDAEEELYKIINISKNRVDLYFDAMQAINSDRNKNILVYLRGLKYITSSQPSHLKKKEQNEFKELQEEIEKPVKT